MTRPIGPGERAAYDNALRTQEQRIDKLVGLLREVATCGVEAEMRGYLTIQINYTTWAEIRAAIA